MRIAAPTAARMLLRSCLLLLCLPRAAAVCPAGWSESPAGGCYRLTDEIATHWGCAELCGADASLACISSEEEITYVGMELRSMGSWVWIGLYRTAGAAEPDGGWSHCSNGEAVNFTNWTVFPDGYSEPDNWEEQAGGVLREEDCSEMLEGTQGLWDWRCDGRASCLCERGAATSSPEYLAAMEAQRAALEAQATRARTWTLLTFVVIIPILWLLPGLLYLVARCIASAYHATPAAVAPPVRRPSEMASAAPLVAAEKADRALRARVSGTAFYVGYILLVISLTPGTMFFLGIDLTTTAGSFVFYATGVPWGTMMLALVLRPIDAIYIRRTNIFLGCVCAGGATVMAFVAFNPAINGGGNPIMIVAFCSMFVVLLFATAMTWSTLGACRKSGERMPPRRQLRRLWLTLRIFFFALAFCLVALFFAPLYNGNSIAPRWRHDDAPLSTLSFGVSCFVAALVSTPTNRGRVHRWLGSLGRNKGDKDHEAASIASLIGKRSAAEALKNAAEAFRSLPLFKLTCEELAKNTPDPAMHAKTDKATLGTVDAFVSHSWSDPGDAKFKQLHEWAGGEDKSIWLDKV